MLILAIDTSGKSGGLALAEGSRNGFRVLESAAIAGGTFSAQLVPTLAMLLEKHGYKAADLGGFVVVSGPGSFTGLRVGLSAIKGLAEVLNKPIATVSLLEALATLSDHQGTVAAALDAGRSEVYSGLYTVADGRAVKINEQLLSQQEFAAQLQEMKPARLMTSDHTVTEAVQSTGVQVQEVARPGTDIVARIGLPKLLSGETVSVEALDANYIRRSDAELFSKPRPSQFQGSCRNDEGQ